MNVKINYMLIVQFERVNCVNNHVIFFLKKEKDKSSFTCGVFFLSHFKKWASIGFFALCDFLRVICILRYESFTCHMCCIILNVVPFSNQIFNFKYLSTSIPSFCMSGFPELVKQSPLPLGLYIQKFERYLY